jgi:hypothetical protein
MCHVCVCFSWDAFDFDRQCYDDSTCSRLNIRSLSECLLFELPMQNRSGSTAGKGGKSGKSGKGGKGPKGGKGGTGGKGGRGGRSSGNWRAQSEGSQRRDEGDWGGRENSRHDTQDRDRSSRRHRTQNDYNTSTGSQETVPSHTSIPVIEVPSADAAAPPPEVGDEAPPAVPPPAVPPPVIEAGDEPPSPFEIGTEQVNTTGNNAIANQESVCSICGSDLWRTRLVVERCLHKFHPYCIQKWWRLSGVLPTCPLCRSDASSNSVIRCNWNPPTIPAETGEIEAGNPDGAAAGDGHGAAHNDGDAATVPEGTSSSSSAHNDAAHNDENAAHNDGDAAGGEDAGGDGHGAVTAETGHEADGGNGHGAAHNDGDEATVPQGTSSSSSSRRRHSQKGPDVPRSWK